MANALKCDRCGQYYDLLKGLRSYQIRNIDAFNKLIDLCPDCYEKLLRFLNNDIAIDERYKGCGVTKEKQDLIGTGELYPGEFESRHYEFEEDSE